MIVKHLFGKRFPERSKQCNKKWTQKILHSRDKWFDSYEDHSIQNIRVDLSNKITILKS